MSFWIARDAGKTMGRLYLSVARWLVRFPDPADGFAPRRIALVRLFPPMGEAVLLLTRVDFTAAVSDTPT